MMTKEQERAALNKITKILESLEDDSYVKTAFAGCVEYAEENIHDDALCSPYYRAVELDTENEKLTTKIEQLEGTVASHNEMNNLLRDQLHKLNHEKDSIAELLEKECDKLDRVNEANNKLHDEIALKDNKIEMLEAELIRLKAKLYDLIIKD